MANLSEKKQKVLTSIAAIRTLLDSYPSLTTPTYGLNSVGENSFTFMFSILRLLGVTEADIVNKWATFLSGKGGDGILNAIEEAVKFILLSNIKNMFTCSLNPIIPNDLFDKYYVKNGDGITIVGGKGIELDLDTIDIYGVLSNCPVDKNGSIFYFDALTSDYNVNDSNDGNGGSNPYSQGYTVNELWKSRDFNAFLWYAINKGSVSIGEVDKIYWDNRIEYLNVFSKNATVKDAFFNAKPQTAGCTTVESWDQVKYPVPGTSINKKQYVKCVFSERPENSVKRNVLKVYLNGRRYFHTRKIRLKKNSQKTLFRVNKTLFEFNYDFIFSLKLFDSKTIVANIINAVFGLVQSITPRYTIRHDVISAQINAVVKRMIAKDDNETDGAGRQTCYYTFSNEEYERMLTEAIQRKNGTYVADNTLNTVNYEELFSSINEISKGATAVQETQAIANAFSTAKNSLIERTDLPDVYGIYAHDSWSWGLEIIERLLNETVTQIVMQILSPKVALLFKINGYAMGNLDSEDDSWQMFMKNWENLVIALVKDIKDRFLAEMYQWVISEFKPLIELFISKLMLETIRYYRELLVQLLDLCTPLNLTGGNNQGLMRVAKYVPADIVPSADGPNNDSNC